LGHVSLFPHLSDQERQVDSVQCSLKVSPVRSALAHPALNDFGVTVTFHRPNSFKMASRSFDDAG
jgi:hypothetical protein